MVCTAVTGATIETYQQKLFVAGTKSSEIYVIDIESNELIQTVKTDGNPHGWAATKDGKFIWAAVGFRTPGKTAIAKIDTASGWIIESYPIPGVDDLELVNDDQHLYIPGFGTGCYFVFDTVDRKIIATIETDGLPHNVVAPTDDPGFIYLSPMGRSTDEVKRFAERMGGLKDCNGNPKQAVANDKIYVVDTQTHKAIATIVTGPAPRPITVSNDGARLYANVDGLLGIAVLDLRARKVIQRAEYPLTAERKAIISRAHGIWISPNQKEVWSTDANHNAVFVFDRTLDPIQFVARISTGKGPYWISFSPNGKYGYTSNQYDATVSVIDAASHKEIARISLPNGSVPKSSIAVNVPVSQRVTEQSSAGSSR